MLDALKYIDLSWVTPLSNSEIIVIFTHNVKPFVFFRFFAKKV